MLALIEYVRFASLSSSGTSVSRILPCHLILSVFLGSLSGNSYVSWHVHVSQAYKRVGIPQPCMSISDSIPLPDIRTKSAKSYTSFGSSGSNLINSVFCSGKSVSQIGEFINNLQFLSIHSDGWFAVRLSRSLADAFLC